MGHMGSSNSWADSLQPAMAPGPSTTFLVPSGLSLDLFFPPTFSSSLHSTPQVRALPQVGALAVSSQHWMFLSQTS